MASRVFDIDARGLLGVREQLALLQLKPQLRRRLLNNVSKRVRTMSRQRIRSQQNLDGSPFAPRKNTEAAFAPRKNTEAGKRKMEAGLGKLMMVTSLTEDQAVLGWRNGLTSWVAAQQHNGTSERRTAQQMRRWNRVSAGDASTQKQAKRLRRLGFRVRMAGKKSLTRPSVAWILEHVSFMQAGLLIRILDEERGETTGADSWEIKLPKRQFLGANAQETSTLLTPLTEHDRLWLSAKSASTISTWAKAQSPRSSAISFSSAPPARTPASCCPSTPTATWPTPWAPQTAT